MYILPWQREEVCFLWRQKSWIYDVGHSWLVGPGFQNNQHKLVFLLVPKIRQKTNTDWDSYNHFHVIYNKQVVSVLGTFSSQNIHITMFTLLFAICHIHDKAPGCSKAIFLPPHPCSWPPQRSFLVVQGSYLLYHLSYRSTATWLQWGRVIWQRLQIWPYMVHR